MAYTYKEYPDDPVLSQGELLVENAAKGLWQIVPNVSRPYNLMYNPDNNNVYAITNLNDIDDNYQHIKVVE